MSQKFSTLSATSATVTEARKKINRAVWRSIVGDATLQAGDEAQELEVNAAAPCNITVPNNSTVSFPIGTTILITWYGAGRPTIVAAAGVTIYSDGPDNVMPQRYSPVMLRKRSTNEWFLWGIGGTTGGGGGDTTPPTRSYLRVQNATPSRLDGGYDETLNAGSVPAAGDFGLLVDGVASNPIVSVAIVGSEFQLTLTDPVVAGQVLQLTYTGGSNRIKDTAGNDAATFTNIPVDNNVVGGGLYSDDYINRVIAQSVDPDYIPGKEALVRTCIDGIDDDGGWPNIVSMKLLAWGDPGATAAQRAAACALNMKSDTHNGSFPNVPAWSFADDSVDALDGFAAFITLGVNPSLDLLQDDCMLIFYIPTGGAISFQCVMGCGNTTTDRRFRALWNGGSVYAEIASPQADHGAFPLPSGLVFIYRDNSANYKIAVDGVDVHTITETSTGLPDAPLVANCDSDQDGTKHYAWDKPITLVGCSKAGDATFRTNLASRLNTMIAGL